MKTMREWSNPFAGGTPAARAHATKMLLAACAIVIALYFVPYAGFVTYPLRILVTFIHEGSHALMALVLGGAVSSVAIQPDGSGVTMAGAAPGLPSMLVASAGYLGATLYGALVIGLLRRGIPGRVLLLVTGALVGMVTLGVFLGLLATHNLFGLGWGCLLTLALGIAGWKLSPKVAGWFAAFIGVQCVANAFFDLNTLFSLSVSTGVATDARNMQSMTLIPAAFWAVLWLATAVGMLWFVLRPGRKTA